MYVEMFGLNSQVTSEFEGVYLVLCVDYGITVTTSLVYPLLQPFGDLPPMALQCALCDVRPVKG